MADKYVWHMGEQLPDGHRLFVEVVEKGKAGIAIADNSGREPQDTDDGILWLDLNRPLMVGSNDKREMFTIPLLGMDGEETRTISDSSTLLFLSAEYDWPIVDQRNRNNVYRVRNA